MSNPTVAFYTLGCKLNFAESSTLARLFQEQGYEVRQPAEQADVYVINTCAVTAQAESKGRNIIRKLHRQAPDALIVVTGCYAQLQAQKLGAIKGVDMVLGNDEKFLVFDRIREYHPDKAPVIAQHSFKTLRNFHSAYSTTGRTRSFLKIQDGCDHWCSFCTIPMARGKSRNAPRENLMEQAKRIAKDGFKEVVLTGVNVADYGKTTGESLISLLQDLEQVEGIERFRISSMEPELISDKLIDFVAQSARFLPHFHIPLQSGSNAVLKAMRRRYARELFADRVQAIHAVIPDAFIGADVIVGFPGEKSAHFQDTYAFLQELPASYYHVFSYSDRPGTRASRMGDKAPHAQIKQRSKQLNALAAAKQLAFYKKQRHTYRQVLFEHKYQDGWMYGFTENYVKTGIPYQEGLVNKIVQVKLSDLMPDGLFTAEIQPEHVR